MPKIGNCAILYEGMTSENTSILHDFNQGKGNASFLDRKTLLILLAIGVLGVVSGFFLAKKGGNIASTQTSTSADSAGTVIGSNDTKTFKDTAEGTLKEGGIEDEGQYHLVRPGGESQNVYLTSSVVDLSEFIGKKIRVWGKTEAAQKAGWLMDVGRVEVL